MQAGTYIYQPQKDSWGRLDARHENSKATVQ